MTKFQRIKQVIYGLIMIMGALIMFLLPKESYPLIIIIFAFGFILNGISDIWYYLTMARFMVGGRVSLFRGVILFDFGILTGTLTGVPHYYILLYLVGLHGFIGVVEVLRVIETRKAGSSSWKLKLLHGVMDILIAIVGLIYIKQPSVTVIIYSIGLMYSAMMRIISAFRRTRLVIIK